MTLRTSAIYALMAPSSVFRIEISAGPWKSKDVVIGVVAFEGLGFRV